MFGFIKTIARKTINFISELRAESAVTLEEGDFYLEVATESVEILALVTEVRGTQHARRVTSVDVLGRQLVELDGGLLTLLDRESGWWVGHPTTDHKVFTVESPQDHTIGLHRKGVYFESGTTDAEYGLSLVDGGVRCTFGEGYRHVDIRATGLTVLDNNFVVAEYYVSGSSLLGTKRVRMQIPLGPFFQSGESRIAYMISAAEGGWWTLTSVGRVIERKLEDGGFEGGVRTISESYLKARPLMGEWAQDQSFTPHSVFSAAC